MHARCATAYRQAWSRHWNGELANEFAEKAREIDQAAISEEKEATRILSAFKDAVVDARALSAKIHQVEPGKAIVSGPASAFVLALSPLLEQLGGALQRIESTVLLRPDGRAFDRLARTEAGRFVERCLTNAEFATFFGCCRRPTINEIADIWLLCGGWPSVREWPERGLSVADLVERQRAAVAAAAKAIGQP